MRVDLDLAPLPRDEQEKLLSVAPYRLGDWAPEILPVRASLKMSRLSAAVTTPRDLGHAHAVSRRAITESAQEESLRLMPVRVVPGLRLAYASQPVGTYIRIIHKPIVGPGGRELGFALRSDGQFLWLLARETGGDDALWPIDCQFMFMRTLVETT